MIKKHICQNIIMELHNNFMKIIVDNNVRGLSRLFHTCKCTVSDASNASCLHVCLRRVNRAIQLSKSHFVHHLSLVLLAAFSYDYFQTHPHQVSSFLSYFNKRKRLHARKQLRSKQFLSNHVFLLADYHGTDVKKLNRLFHG